MKRISSVALKSLVLGVGFLSSASAFGTDAISVAYVLEGAPPRDHNVKVALDQLLQKTSALEEVFNTIDFSDDRVPAVQADVADLQNRVTALETAAVEPSDEVTTDAMTGYVRVQRTLRFHVNMPHGHANVSGRNVQCPEGKQVISGGYQILRRGDNTTSVNVIGSEPFRDTGWRVETELSPDFDRDTSSLRIRMWAMCIDR